MNRPLGHLNYWLERTRGRVAWVSTASSIAVFLKIFDLSPWWLATLIPLVVLSILLDRRYIAPGEVEAATKINPQWWNMMEILEDIRKQVKR